MRLKQIKLVGFKSFVDITKISFQQQMTAIVGPNGCGKSNVIDAVRWVLGESSAKNLRGDAMTDVIFNGAASRKPVGQASVELIFENTQGRLQGSMADRSEVAIRRVVTRDAISTYYLNGSKCRRRDITDIFLGTGLGPRSYAIIEQGTISRLIESKPQELRVFIEEAAGISKYKEKRRDTENRIRHTRENLERLSDVIAELATHIDKLHQQAQAAKRFKTLKSSERKYKAELAAMRWQQFDAQRQQAQYKMRDKQLTIESLRVTQTQYELDIFKAKQKLDLGNEQISEFQQQKLQLSNDITRLEQHLKYRKQQLGLDEKQRQQLQDSLASNNRFQQHQQNELANVKQLLAEQQPELVNLEQELQQNQDRLDKQQTALQQCFTQWQNANNKQTTYQQQLSSSEIKITAQQSLIGQSKHQLLQTEQKLIALKETQNNSEIAELEKYLQQLQPKAIQLKGKHIQAQNELDQLEKTINEQQQQVVINQTKLQSLTESLAQLEKTQQKPSTWLKNQNTWLNKNKISPQGQLYQQLIVPEQWQISVEMILSHWLSAQIIDQFPSTNAALDQLPDPLLLMVTSASFAFAEDDKKVNTETLAGQISAQTPLAQQFINSCLAKIYLKQDIMQAQQKLKELKSDESILCVDGTWLSPFFVRRGNIENQDMLLVRQTQITQQQAQIQTFEQSLSSNDETLVELKADLNGTNKNAQSLNKECAEINTEIQQTTQKLALAEQQQQHQYQLIQQAEQALKAHQQQLAQQTQQLEKLLQQQQQILQSQDPKNNTSLTTLAEQRIALQQELLDLQNKNQQLVQQRHQMALSVAKTTSQQENIEQKIHTSIEKQQHLHQNLQQLNNSDKHQEAPLAEQEQQLQTWLVEMSTLELKLSQQHQSLADSQQQIDHIAQQKAQQFSEIEQLKEKVNKDHLNAENARLRAQTLLEQLDEMGQTVSKVSANMPNNAKESQWQAQLIILAKEISLLGAINLAAIDEYEQELARKNFLDQQYQDLVLAINTLENAIAKIDKQSRQKFKTTFEQVNNDLKSLFPRVFGGGNAYLALTGDDMLETGVTIMARPPGKKNSTIHLLSGGEKALTALSLVFAIFRLNPAPFCMLDEVDAPLDDANVLRFCNLVKEMSKSVQFIYISHNKIAMEMAAHLTGVTMAEAGVSRVVSVDIDQAVAMTES